MDTSAGIPATVILVTGERLYSTIRGSDGAGRRLLEAQGFRVGISASRLALADDFARLGKPNLYFG